MAVDVKLSGRNVTVNTLNVAQVRELVEEMKTEFADGKSIFDINIVDLLFDDEVPAKAVSKATGLSLQELAGPHDPQEVKTLIDEVRAQNPFYVAMMERLVTVGVGAAAKVQETSSPE